MSYCILFIRKSNTASVGSDIITENSLVYSVAIKLRLIFYLVQSNNRNQHTYCMFYEVNHNQKHLYYH